MTSITNVLMPENSLLAWRQLPQQIRDFTQAVYIGDVAKVRAVVEYRYRDAVGNETRLFEQEWYDEDMPVAFILGPDEIYGVKVDITEYRHMPSPDSIERHVVYVAVAE